MIVCRCARVRGCIHSGEVTQFARMFPRSRAEIDDDIAFSEIIHLQRIDTVKSTSQPLPSDLLKNIRQTFPCITSPSKVASCRGSSSTIVLD